jgi:predicted ribosome quality control (RQC) complex YloA/Tae2 family protein
MMEGFVSARECSVCRNNADKQDGVTERRLNKHSDEIQDLTRISDQLTQLMSSMVETQNKMDKRLEAIEKLQLEMEIEKEAKEKAESKKPRWYETKIGEWVIKTSVLLIIFVVGAAIGQDLIPDLLKVFKGGN